MSLGELTGAGQFLGTPDYAAPEQINGRPVDGRADQYALGCVAWTLLGGRVPFVREEPMAVLYAHLSEPPPPLTVLRPDLPGAVDEVLARALAKSPKDRFPSCGDFADALREALDLESLRSRPPGPCPACPGRTISAPSPPRRAAGGGPAGRHVAGAMTAKPADVRRTRRPPGRPAARTPPLPPAQTWIAVVGADRTYYDSLHVDPSEISFPDGLAERRFPLSGTEVRIGRRSVSGKIEPEIDLTGPPSDPAISRLQAVLSAGPDGSWSITDPGSPNGILVNGKEAPSGEAVPLRDGDRIHLGAWTVITIIHG